MDHRERKVKIIRLTWVIALLILAAVVLIVFKPHPAGLMDNEGQVVNYTGYCIYGPRGNLFKRSPDGQYFFLSDETGELRNRHEEMTFMKDEPVYAEVEGYLEESPIERWLDPVIDYVLIVTTVIDVDYVQRENPIFPFEFRCYGNEPFWNLDIINNDEAIFKDIGMESVLYMRYVEPKIEGGIYIYEFEHHAGGITNAMNVIIKKAPCSDTMSGEKFEYTVTVEYDGRTYEGCAKMTGE